MPTEGELHECRGVTLRVSRDGEGYVASPIDENILAHGADDSAEGAIDDFVEAMEMTIAHLEKAVKLYDCEDDKRALEYLRSVWEDPDAYR